MLRTTAPRAMSHGMVGGLRFIVAMIFLPNTYRDHLALNNTHKIERALRLQTAIKANKVDFRALLSLPVTDYAHPYKIEYPWEKAIQTDKKSLSLYGKWYHNKVMVLYESLQWHRLGMTCDDMIQAHGWWNRAARTRCPKDKVIHADRRATRARAMRDAFLYHPFQNWTQPVDNVAWFGPYCVMVADEWEEKWGFFAGTETEF